MTITGKHIRLLGTVILLAGLLSAVIVYFTAPPPPDEHPGILGLDIRTKRDRLQLERIGGSNYVLMKDFDDWFASLWHGRRLGATLGVLSLLGFLACRGLARLEDDLAANPEPEYPAKKENP
jgi:hypothetical protein